MYVNNNVKFSDSFWETDFNGTLGFEHLCRRIKDGQKTCRDIEDFLKKKSKAESQYGKALRNLARTDDGKEEIGDLGLSWRKLKQQTEKEALLHEDAAAKHALLADEIWRFADHVKIDSKCLEERVKDRQKVKKAAHSRMVDLQRSYHEKCRESIGQDNQHDTAKQSVTVSVKDIEKMKQKADKCKELTEKADGLYKQSVEYLEQTRRAWEADMEEACQTFQRTEEDRITLVREVLWKCTNVDSKLCVEKDECCESVRLCLERCDVINDIRGFIDNFRTGSCRPAPIEYENYFGDKKNDIARAFALRQKLRPNQPLPILGAQYQGAGCSHGIYEDPESPDNVLMSEYSYASVQ